MNDFTYYVLWRIGFLVTFAVTLTLMVLFADLLVTVIVHGIRQ